MVAQFIAGSRVEFRATFKSSDPGGLRDLAVSATANGERVQPRRISDGVYAFELVVEVGPLEVVFDGGVAESRTRYLVAPAIGSVVDLAPVPLERVDKAEPHPLSEYVDDILSGGKPKLAIVEEPEPEPEPIEEPARVRPDSRRIVDSVFAGGRRGGGRRRP